MDLLTLLALGAHHPRVAILMFPYDPECDANDGAWLICAACFADREHKAQPFARGVDLAEVAHRSMPFVPPCPFCWSCKLPMVVT